MYIARDDGPFAQQGHVTIEKVASSQAILASQLKGHVDNSAGSYLAYIAAQAAGAKLRILAEASPKRVDFATATLNFGMLGRQYASEVQQGTLVESMIAPGS